MARKLTAVAFSLGCLHASSSFALGLGDIKLDSFLNEPLEASVDLLNTAGLHEDEIHIRLASRDDFDRLGVERAYFLTSIQFDVNIDASGRGTITIKSEEPVLEPYLDFIVEARWPSGRLLREYTVLLDPPLFETGTRVVSASERVEEVEGIPAPESEAKKPQGAAATSGTRVDVRESDLGPGEMPQRDFNAETSGTPMPGSRYMISRDDTLWEIASRGKPAGASVHQTMLDIQRLNPDAFINGNINQIKAGYIIYLPKDGDISSQDLQTALAEVKQQNEDWRAGRPSAPSSGPSLRISAEPTETSAAVAGESPSAMNAGAAGASNDGGSGAAAEIAELQDLVKLKDQQIADLQEALAEARSGAGSAGDSYSDETALDSEDAMAGEIVEGEMLDAAEQGAEYADEAALDQSSTGESAMEPEPEPEAAEVAPAPQPKPQPRPAPPPEDSGWLSYLLYGLGAIVLAILVFLFLRRRGADDEEETELPTSASARDAFADVKLKSTPAGSAAVTEDIEDELDLESDIVLDAEPVVPNRGYGERKHDEYAADVDSNDALAEADIYIAYGRYPQARELLRNALDNEPDNSAYRLKLVEAEINMGNRPAAREQMYELEARGDSAAAARARELLGESESQSMPPAGLAEEVGGSLEADFAGLEIEDGIVDVVDDLDDDLDLSADFADSPLGDDDDDDEDLVIAADANGMSTKLDLARAYLDMGDEDGARQILEEVIAEGSDEYRSEAEALLERID
ncbi:FimV family protein [Haliea sp. E17]|uniref:type IV pilus assembly protein FimV n=1 Tax=Haliea sp. E17 TaxID=3401576 RepID=UPI003AAD6F02